MCPPPGCAKINFYGAWWQRTNTGGWASSTGMRMGFLLRGRQSYVAVAHSELLMEALAARAAVLLAGELGLNYVIMERDSQLVAGMLNGSNSVDGSVAIVVEDILCVGAGWDRVG
ncbi:hypothetical protein HYC85_020288 [Camellia sinensis]|uniref:RNase H type-1 domain-containing protein n=1 Tax=Camellia sinensis TaxID=4442 RepID=A0A7J7GT08_CAMSI|nr:hypothetical protein HYC85_020288 [Camellia sinensis]